MATNNQLNNGLGATFSPTFTCGSPGDLSVVYSTANGTYWSVGNLVTVTFYMEFTPTYTTAAGDAIIGNLPFPASALTSSYYVGSVVFFAGAPTFPTSTTAPAIVLSTGTTNGILVASGSAVNTSSILITGFASATPASIYGSISYAK